jgi:hypothetical protein
MVLNALSEALEEANRLRAASNISRGDLERILRENLTANLLKNGMCNSQLERATEVALRELVPAIQLMELHFQIGRVLLDIEAWFGIHL